LEGFFEDFPMTYEEFLKTEPDAWILVAVFQNDSLCYSLLAVKDDKVAPIDLSAMYGVGGESTMEESADYKYTLSDFEQLRLSTEKWNGRAG